MTLNPNIKTKTLGGRQFWADVEYFHKWRIQQNVCADCWNDWLRNYSIKVINELRLDLSTDHGQAEYDRYMREFLGLE